MSAWDSFTSSMARCDEHQYFVDAPRDHKDDCDDNLVPRKVQPVQQLDQLTSEIFNHNLQEWFFPTNGFGRILAAGFVESNIWHCHEKFWERLSVGQCQSQDRTRFMIFWFFLEIVLFLKDG